MPELIPTDHYAKIVWMGKVPQDRPDIRSQAVQEAFASYAGFEGDYHAGLTRKSCVRVKSQHPEGTEIRNVRQFSIVSAEELAAIAAVIGLETLDPVLLGASIVVEGIDDFTHVPPNARLQAANGTTIVVDMQNGPCNFPAREIEKNAPGHGKGFKAAAKDRRGVCAWVEREGQLKVGDTLRLHIPGQRVWRHL
ncbi:MOSC domain-containing protein [Sulfitobacter geojensis]|uniref:MOSC domain-containing protein n=1 Tax=Sulfitobacter geojensis TaxID=1342299 RepID=A0AAE2VXI9_9RHOB|nr:MOSC domain-containing protein [Sulfitobacter geojensis]MBM1689019.1 MOSC domain-containing protein [Sulfitobacter geojensis]MBM1693086.1 MOSC domain-containing protein [Sulfitobacter geojensis]MBM1705252.1 MOSC domain-containing protein [Sulfitobacter geojensis]MBM1709310.1 MOSC domain-containing protein [Sulfitobacter geojensis]MBM1713375.1 MOSC domain-containing protein [Sulfitobacter geojensis]